MTAFVQKMAERFLVANVSQYFQNDRELHADDSLMADLACVQLQ